MYLEEMGMPRRERSRPFPPIIKSRRISDVGGIHFDE
jgi:hypothetical protein